MGSENLSNGSSTAADRGAFAPYRQSRRDDTLSGESLDADLAPRNGASPSLNGLPSHLPPLALEGLAEPVYSPPGSLFEPGSSAAPTSASMVDHPLLRGLLYELPPRGSVPPAGWLDRWFEAARSILELLYQEGSRSR